MKCLGINSWYRVFEPSLLKDSNGTVSLPMKRGTGICKLAKLKNGASAYGIFITMLPIAMASVPRGTLVWSDKDGMKAHDAHSLELITGFPFNEIEEAIALLLEIGWLEWVEFEITATAKKPAPKLEDFVQEMGGKLTHGGASLLEEWTGALKGLAPSKAREIFRKTSPGIQFPNEFKRARRESGL